MNHKRGRPKNRRAGCLMCKRNKVNGFNDEVSAEHTGFGKIRKLIHSKQDMKEELRRMPC